MKKRKKRLKLPKEIRDIFDSWDDELFLAYLFFNYYRKEPIWEKCSKEEYEKENPPVPLVLTEKALLEFTQSIFKPVRYKASPIYNGEHQGLLFQLSNPTPIGYKYYKSTKTRGVLTLSSAMLEYCETRPTVWKILSKNE